MIANLGMFIVETYLGLLESLNIAYFIHHFYEPRKNKSVSFIGVFILTSILMNIWGVVLPADEPLRMPIVTLLPILFTHIFYKGKFISKVTITLTWMIVTLMVDSLTFLIMTEGLKISVEEIQRVFYYKLFGGTVSRVFLIFIASKIKKMMNGSSNMRKIYLLQFIFIASVELVILFALPYYIRSFGSTTLAYYLIPMISVMCGIIIIKLFDYLQSQAKKDAQYQVQMHSIKELGELVNELRAQRHDFNHHVSCLYGLLHQKRFEEANDYISSLVERAKSTNDVIQTSNPYVTALITHKVRNAEAKGIVFDININMPADVNIAPYDLSIVLGNAIDNAVEASQLVEGPKIIKLSIEERLSYLIIDIRNPMLRSTLKPGDLKTTKEDRQNHGFGLKNIKYVISNYGGKMDIDIKDQTFILHILLNNTKVRNKLFKRA